MMKDQIVSKMMFILPGDEGKRYHVSDFYRTVQEITRTRDWSWSVRRMTSDRALTTDRRKDYVEENTFLAEEG